MFLSNTKEKIHQWFTQKAQGKSAPWWLSIISFTESSFFPIPPDPFLIAVLIVKRNAWLKYSLLVAFMSVLGAIFGYVIGYSFYELFGQPLVDFYSLHEELEKVATLFNNNTFWTMFVAAFTPIPFKLFTIAGGLFKVNIFTFVVASVLGRGIRFLIIGYLMKVFGKKIGELIFKYFNIGSIIILVLILGYVGLKFL